MKDRQDKAGGAMPGHQKWGRNSANGFFFCFSAAGKKKEKTRE
jgi:hypothetical protein